MIQRLRTMTADRTPPRLWLKLTATTEEWNTKSSGSRLATVRPAPSFGGITHHNPKEETGF